VHMRRSDCTASLTDVMLAFLFTVFVNNLLSTILMYFVLRCTHGNCLEIEI
jgi:hypothetical protein